jgi:hypothetical protein
MATSNTNNIFASVLTYAAPTSVDVKVVAASYVTRLRDFSVLLTWPPWLG